MYIQPALGAGRRLSSAEICVLMIWVEAVDLEQVTAGGVRQAPAGGLAGG